MAKIGRNEPCPYGSGKKYKRCCMCLMPSQAVSKVSSMREAKRTAPDYGRKTTLLSMR